MVSNYGINRFYTSLSHIGKVYDRFARKDSFKGKNKDEFVSWKDKTRNTLKELIGLDRMEDCTLKSIIEERVVLDNGITREKVIIQVEPDVWMPMYILIPDGCKNNKQAKCYIAPCGHMGGGKYSIAGVDDNPKVKEMIDFFNYDYGLQVAKQGYVVFCPDARGFGERRDILIQDDEDFVKNSCFNLAHMAEPLGMTIIGMQTWDLMRLLDYIEERDEWDSTSVGCIGFSGGGMQALWLSALDERIKKVIISGYMYGYRDSLLILNNNCSCNYVPHLWEHYDCGDIGALIAPRPLIIQSCKDDHLNGKRGVVNAVEQVNIIRDVYDLFDAQDLIIQDFYEGEHRWHSELLEEYMNWPECKIDDDKLL